VPSGADVGQDVVLVAGVVVAVVLMIGLIAGRRPRASRIAPAVREQLADLPRAAIVVNPTKLNGTDAPAWIGRASSALGWGPPIWLETSVADPGGGQAREALARGADTVIAFGGDGTARTVAAELADTGVPLGLIPRGTGNLLARNLSLPLTDPEAALRVALTGSTRPIDLGDVELDLSGEDQEPRRDAFLVMAGIGFDAEVMAAVRPKLKQRVGWWAYVVAGARNMRGRRTRVHLVLDEQTAISRRVRSVIVGNCGLLTGGLALMPDAELDDGVLDIVVVAPRGVVGWAGVTASVLTRRTIGHPVVEHFRCRRAEIRAERPLAVQLDGDPVGEARTMRVAVRPLALLVRCPPKALPRGGEPVPAALASGPPPPVSGHDPAPCLPPARAVKQLMTDNDGRE
jgi:diacylglycerol kinase (ATP)